MLFGVEGLQVTDAQALPDGTLEVWAVTDYPAAAACPDCGTVSARRHDTVLARPRDVRRAGDRVRACWVKRRWKCLDERCARKTFTESLPQVPPRCRLTARLREQAGAEVSERGITPAEAARHAGISWPAAHDAFTAAADPVLEQAPALVAHLGIDEHRRGRPRWRIDGQTGEYTLLADRWHTCFFDLSGGQGLLGQVEGRTADDAAYWLAQATPAWRDAVRVVATGMCSIYASAVRQMLPGARIAVDLFHVVHLAVKMTGDVRRRVVRGKYGRRGRSGDPGVRHQEPAGTQPGAPLTRPVRQGHRRPAGRSGRAGDRRRLDRQGETPARAEPARPRHRLGPVRAQHPGPALRLLRLVRPEPRHRRAGQPGQDGLPVGGRDRLRGADRRHERSGFTLHLVLMIRFRVW